MKLGRITTALLLATPIALTWAPAAHGETIRCAGLDATIVGTPQRDTLRGTPGDDVIVGLGRRDAIYGGEGNDVICGGPAADYIQGGPGDDRILGNRGQDSLWDDEGDDHVSGGRGLGTYFRVGAGDDRFVAGPARPFYFFDQAPGPVTVDLAAGTATGSTGSDVLQMPAGTRPIVEGSAFGDTLLGTEGADAILGKGGADVIDGRGGADYLEASDGVVSGGDGDDRLWLYGGVAQGGTGDDDIEVFPEVASADGGVGDDRMVLWVKGDTISTLPDLSGGEGLDGLWLRLVRSSPTAPFSFDLASGAVQLGDSSSTMPGFESFEVSGEASMFDITGTDGSDVLDLSGTSSPTSIRGLGGDDTIVGGHGDDLIDGGPGADVADALEGVDTCLAVETPTNCEIVTP
jgi:Ca2+-binding RTX toxin-like protein